MMARDNSLLYALIGVGAYLWFMQSRTGGYAAPAPSSTPLAWWIAVNGDPRTLTQTSPSYTPPAPGYRPASEYELAQAGHPDAGTM